jgi:nucleoside-diphosphate-sugar epimerase
MFIYKNDGKTIRIYNVSDLNKDYNKITELGENEKKVNVLNLYGPGVISDINNIIGETIKSIENKLTLNIKNDLEKKHSFFYSKDLDVLTNDIFENWDKYPQVINIKNNEEITLFYFIEAIMRYFKEKVPTKSERKRYKNKMNFTLFDCKSSYEENIKDYIKEIK